MRLRRNGLSILQTESPPKGEESGLRRHAPSHRIGRTAADLSVRNLTRPLAVRTLWVVLTETITSRQNPLIKRAQRIRRGAEPGHMFIDGSRLVEEAVASEIALEALIYTPEWAATERGAAVLERLALEQYRGALVPEQVLRAVCDVETPQGVIALAAQPVFGLEELFSDERPLVVALDALQDPGNVGTIVRAAEAAGASGVAVSPGTAEPYGPKALRASMGSAFRLPIARRTSVDEAVRAATERGLTVLATAVEGGTHYTDHDWRKPTLVLVGNEGAGLSPDTLALADRIVSIPLAPPVESLNAAVATAVMLFEAVRQRGALSGPPTEAR